MKSRQLALFPALLPLLLAAPADRAHAAPPPAKVPARPAPKGPAKGATAAPREALAAVGRWIAETPDGMIDAQRARGETLAAKADPESEIGALAALATIASLSDRGSFGAAEKALLAIGEKAASPLVRTEARLLARAASGRDGAPEAQAESAKDGLVTHFALTGPFRDTGGGLQTKEGPEADGFKDPRGRYAWGSVDVFPRPIPASYALARGVPLDVFVAPRKESCSYLASAVTTDDKPFVVRVAASGQVRATFDGKELGSAEDAHGGARFDRLAARVTTTAGPHVLAVKVCTGAIVDGGRVRVRITDESGVPREFPSTADTSGATAAATTTVTPVETALTRALAAVDKRDALSPESTLARATLRTLGGADDLRSPRAPGMLDGLFHGGPALPADRLAFAAWITPSGATRSGNFELARQAAATASDSDATRFIARRKLAEHLTAGLFDWAMIEKTSSGVAVAKDTEATLLTALLDGQSGVEPARIAAFRALVARFREDRAHAPMALLGELLGQSRPLDRRVFDEIIAEYERRGFRGSFAVEGALTKDAPARAKAAQEALGRLDGADEGVGVIRLAASVGDWDTAYAAARTMAIFAPNRADVFTQLSRAAAAAEGAAGKATVQAALRRARDLEPGDGKVRAELAYRAAPPGGPRRGDEPTRGDVDKYIVPSDVVLARRRGVPEGQPITEEEREIYWLRSVHMEPDGRVSQVIQYGKEVVIPPQTEDDLYENLPLEGDYFEIVRARVHRKGGGIAYPVEEFDDGRRPRIRWPELAPGDVTEVVIRSWTSHAVGGRGDAPFTFFDYAGATTTRPLLYNRVVVTSPKDKPIHVDVLHAGAMKRTERDEGDEHVVDLVWDAPVVVPDEPFAPPLSEIVPLVVGSTFKDWGAFRKWYGEAVKGFTEPDDQIRRLAAELTKGKTTRDEKLKALFEFVADDIRYVNYVSGEWWLPNRPQQLLARREGDCDDKAILLISLLKAVGIEAEEVLVQTRQTNMPSVLKAPGAAVPQFDHGIAFLPGPGGGRYLDATSPQSRLGPIPSMDARAVALRMSGPAEIVELPNALPSDHGSDVTWDVRVDRDGGARIDGRETHMGDSAFFLRTALREEEGRAQYVEQNLVSGFFPGVSVEKGVRFQGDLAGGKSDVSYQANSETWGRKEGELLVLPLASSATLASTFAPSPSRLLPVEIPSQLAPSHRTITFVVQAPPGASWGTLPKGGTVDGGEFGKASLAFTQAGDKVTVKRTIAFDANKVPVAKYQQFRNFLLETDALMHKSLRLDVRNAKELPPPKTAPKLPATPKHGATGRPGNGGAK